MRRKKRKNAFDTTVSVRALDRISKKMQEVARTPEGDSCKEGVREEEMKRDGTP